MYHWTYRLQFSPPVKDMIGFDLCELIANRTVAGEKTLLAKGDRVGCGWGGPGYKDVTVHVMTTKARRDPRSRIGSWSRGSSLNREAASQSKRCPTSVDGHGITMARESSMAASFSPRQTRTGTE